MGRRSKGRVNVSRILVLNEEKNVTRYYETNQPSKEIALPKPMTRDEFHQYLNQAESNNKMLQERQTIQQSAISLPSSAAQSPSLVVHREYGFTNPEFERGPNTNSFNSTVANNRFCFSDEEEDDIFVFNAELLMKDQSIFDGAISTYDSTALYSKDHE